MGIIPIVKMYYPDELMYSWVCRLAKANGLTLKEFYREYMGDENVEYYSLNYDLKRNFAFLCERMYMQNYMVKLFLNTTTFRFEAMMMTEEQQAKIVNSVFGIQNKLNAPVYNMVKNINICPECMKEDIEKFGEPYLHCSHQLFGVQTCYKHKCLLHVFTGKKGHECDFDEMDYTELQTKISIESNNVYSEYIYTLFQSNINTNKWIVRDILLERINEMGKDQFLGKFGKWKYYDLADYDVQRVLKKKVLWYPRNLLKNELISMAMFLYPDVNELIQKLKEKSLDSVISEYTCPNCGKTYISTPFMREELFGCPFCNTGRSEQEILSNIFEKNGYELRSEFESLGKPVTLFHRDCENTISIKPRVFLFENIRCTCRREEAEWNRRCEQYMCYIMDNNGNPYIPEKLDYEGEHLGIWAQNQRVMYKVGKLSVERYEKLQSVGFIFDPAENEWNRHYEQYKRYIKTSNGNPYIPTKMDYEGEHLGKWAQTQRRMYKAGKLSAERYEKLQSVGFIFDLAENEWNRRYEQYKRYIKTNNGDSYIPNNMDYEGEHLGKWVKTQRGMYKAGKLSVEHYEKLQSVGFIFDSVENEWNRRYEQYKRYIKTNNGDPYISKRMNYEGEHLGEWVKTQRTMYKSGKISQERYEKLKKIGMKFE